MGDHCFLYYLPVTQAAQTQREPPPQKNSHSEDKLSEQGWAVSSKMERKTPHFMGYCLTAPGWRSLQQASGWSQGQGSSEWGREVGTQGMSVFMVSLGSPR